MTDCALNSLNCQMMNVISCFYSSFVDFDPFFHLNGDMSVVKTIVRFCVVILRDISAWSSKIISVKPKPCSGLSLFSISMFVSVPFPPQFHTHEEKRKSSW